MNRLVLLLMVLISGFAWGQNFQPLESDEDVPVSSQKEDPKSEPSKKNADGEAEKESPEKGESFSGVVRFIRGGTYTEVLFVDAKETLVIPRGREHNKILEACLQSSKSRSSIQVRIDRKSRQILSLESAPGSPSKSGQEGAK